MKRKLSSVGLALLWVVLATGTLVPKALALDAPHDWASNSIYCDDCHVPHDALGSSLTSVAGNVNLCLSCHTSGGQASGRALNDADRADPYGSNPATDFQGTSHAWGVSRENTAADSTDPNPAVTTEVEERLESGNITCSACHDQHNHSKGQPFLRISNTGSALCNECHQARYQSSSPYTSHPVGVAMGGSTTKSQSDTLPLYGSQVECLSCHKLHYSSCPDCDGGLATGGTTTSLTDTSKNWTTDALVGWQVIFDDRTRRDITSNTSDTISWSSPLSTAVQAGDRYYLYNPSASGDGYLLLRPATTSAFCLDCHNFPTSGIHFDSSQGALWPGPEASTFTSVSDYARVSGSSLLPWGATGGTTSQPLPSSYRGTCFNCHWPHGWKASGQTDKFSKLLVDDNTNAELCFTCHDGDPVSPNIYAMFNPANPSSDTSSSGASINQVHDPASVGCPNCHNPHYVTSSQKVMNPDDTTQPWTQTYATSNTYQGKSYRSSSTNLDPVNPEGGGTIPATIGSAQPDSGNTGDDVATSGGSYTGTEDQTYTVEVTTGGAPGTAQITVTSTGSDSSGPTTVTAWDTPVAVGNYGVTISFSSTVSASIGSPVCLTDCLDDTATSGGTYTGSSNGKYYIEVTTGGRSGQAILTCTTDTGFDCASSPTYTWYDNTPISIGSYGVEITIDDPDNRDKDITLNDGEKWEISVTAAANADGVLTLGDKWTIAVTAEYTSCGPSNPCTEPDYVAFCLACHDGSPPAGITMDPNMINIASAYFNKDQHGNQDGATGSSISKGYKKVPWTTQADYDSGKNPTDNYAAIQCTTCHDGHGSDNLFHLKTSIDVGGWPMKVGGKSGSEFSGITPSTTYTLPCFDSGDNVVPCDDPSSQGQKDHRWGAWCTFCHEMSNHPGVTERSDCQGGHMHDGGNF